MKFCQEAQTETEENQGVVSDTYLQMKRLIAVGDYNTSWNKLV